MSSKTNSKEKKGILLRIELAHFNTVESSYVVAMTADC